MALDVEVNPGGPRAFVQTARAAGELDRWRQIGEDEAAMAADMVRRNELSGGTPVVREFEQAWRAWMGTKFAVSVVNGTSALYSAYFGLGVGPGDEVVCPVNTWICSIAPALLLGARPVFCDINPDTLLIDPADMKRKITPRTRCLCAVHLWGNVCDMDAIMAVSRETGVAVVEDCSHAHGAKYKGRMCGAIGHVGAWSLQGSKAVSAGEGGMIATDDLDVFERACLVGQVNRIAGIDLVGAKYAELQPLGLGMKFRAHPLGIGIAAVQLKKLPELNRRRAAYFAEVEAGLDSIPGLRPITVHEGAERGGFYGFPIIHEPEAMGGLSTADYVERIKALGVGASLSPYPNLHDLPLFAKGFDIFTRNRGPLCANEGYTGYRPGDFPNAERAMARTIFLPVLSDPAPGAAQAVLRALREAAGA
ncbi:MAG TPA: DegT/DnrJ/EryC1/StrS family aminotransferase [Candidatus Hydrogenedentes bacterium]|nr:DegT/DnrJ/EryC1/StrS family aminotransferase [Candidatus Hydrogenedentota bacterium]HRT21686.1 DegT/DnrJ/EryC1/StrS family aminotransferase [Candidatus Hydrogenedentota bacterium]HRT66527.1 DegT/DnrJ/EryC1/StrS family aminotransferase [Candidatus Hydrogenedentota bacterium]